jgi:transcriptional regulator GlxA family with amidase domain
MDRHEDIVAEREVIEDVLRGFRDTLDAHLDSHPPYVQQMLKYIHDHLFDSTLAIEEVKKACRLSNNNITTKFRHSVGLGTREYIRSQRLKVAAAILHKMDVNIYLVADAVGYTEEAFSKLFK